MRIHSLSRRQALSVTVLMGAMCCTSGATWADTFPSKPIKIVVPMPAGGGPDLVARVVGEKISAQLGQPVVVENRPGAGAILGASVVAKSDADGHTLLLAPNTLAISAHVLPGTVNFKLQSELTPVIAPVTTPMVLVTNPKTGVKSLSAALELMRTKPGMSVGSAGNGSPMHFAIEMFQLSTQVDLLHVPYKGVAPSLTAGVGGEVNYLFTPLGGAVPYIKAGQLVPLAVLEKQRTPLLPDVPTALEQGVKDVEIVGWYGLFAPKGTPAAAVDTINQAFNAALQLDDVRNKLTTAGMTVLGGTPEQLTEYVKFDDERYGRLARELKIQVD